MREIKFMVWIDSGDRDGTGIMYSSEQVTVGVDEVGCDGDWMDRNDPDVFLRQYTSLKDKNGKEIYEGDYIKGLGAVKWSNVDGAWIVGEWLLYKKVHIEVIGNIYENPELLET